MKRQTLLEMPFSDLYRLLVNKAVRKNRTPAEVDRVICWLTGYDASRIAGLPGQAVTCASFFENAPAIEERCRLVTGTVCGVRVEMIDDPLMRRIRCLDKLIDELAKGKPLERILRTAPAPKTEDTP